MPAPAAARSEYCPSHQHLTRRDLRGAGSSRTSGSPPEPASHTPFGLDSRALERSVRGNHRPGRVPAPSCSWASMSAARSPTPCSPGRRAVHGQGAHHAGRPVRGRDGGGGRGARARRSRQPEAVERFAHGMTVATNALLEERGARTALLTTEGFTDVSRSGARRGPSCTGPARARPPPLVPPELRFACASASAPTASRRPLARTRSTQSLDAHRAALEPESVAVCLLHSYADPDHERRGRAGARAAPAGRSRLLVARGPRASSASTSARRRP